MGYGDMYLEFNFPAGQGLSWGILTLEEIIKLKLGVCDEPQAWVLIWTNWQTLHFGLWMRQIVL